MSVRHLALVADVTGLPPTCKLVLYALAISANLDGEVIITNPQLRQRTGLSERTVRNVMHRLRELGWLDAHAPFHITLKDPTL